MPIKSTIMPGAEPYFQRGGSTGCLCLHGFTASPAEVRWFAAHLAEAGHTVYVPRLAGHGTIPQDLARFRWTDWYASALDGYHLLKQQCDQIFVCGLSMGALLALFLSAELPVDGVIALAAPLVIYGRPQNIALVRLLKYVMGFTNQADMSVLPQRVLTEQTRRGEAAVGRVRYDLWSTAGYEQFLRLQQVVIQRLPAVNAPLLLIFSEKDATVKLASQQIICEQAGSRVIETRLLKESGHVMTLDIEMQKVFDWSRDFIAHQIASAS
ncbi:MAG: alpha/beta fold hydrolase [Chloroflexota bacterium]